MTWGFFISNQFKKHDPLLSVFSVPIKALRKILTKRGFYGKKFKKRDWKFSVWNYNSIPNWKLGNVSNEKKTVRSLYLIFSAKINRYVCSGVINWKTVKFILNFHGIFVKWQITLYIENIKKRRTNPVIYI